jgi:hypothetical protein
LSPPVEHFVLAQEITNSLWLIVQIACKTALSKTQLRSIIEKLLKQTALGAA